MNLLSVVVPMYNEQENIENCINILKSQINQNFDVIFINDGSKDNTIENLRNCLNLGVEFNYKIIEQENKGAAAARKNGIDNALTEFIMIYDCDDKLSNNIIEEFYSVYDKYPEVDIIMPNVQMQIEDGGWNEFNFYTQSAILKPIDCIKNSIDGWYVHGWYIVKKNVFNKSYSDYKNYNAEEDNYINNDEVITRLNFLNSKIIVRSNATYFYCYNSLSTTKKINEKKYLTIKNAVILNKIFKKNNEINIKTKAELISNLWGAYVYIHKYQSKIRNLDDWNNELKNSLNYLNYLNIIATRLAIKKKVQLTILKLLYLF